MLSLADALAAVKDLTEPTLDPALSDAELTNALTRGQVAATWVASTAYSVGQRIIPTIPEGRVFVCVLAGTSDTAEPPWLIAPQYTGAVNPLGAWWGIGAVPFVENVTTSPWFWGLADGTCAWRFDSAFAGEIYDVRSAAAEAWRMKARKAVNRYDVAIGNSVNAKRSQLYDHCMMMARSLQPVRVV